MTGPLEIGGSYRRAAILGMWFAAAFAVVFAVIAALSWLGFVGKPEDASMALLMALGGAVLFISMRLIIRLFVG
jgi:hypothetical protein